MPNEKPSPSYGELLKNFNDTLGRIEQKVENIHKNFVPSCGSTPKGDEDRSENINTVYDVVLDFQRRLLDLELTINDLVNVI